MKNTLFTIFILLCTECVNAQLNTNWDFSQPNLGNDIYGGGIEGPCPTFSNTSIPGWQRSHGGPHIGSDAIWFQTSPTTAANNQGIFTNFTFASSQTYDIEIGLAGVYTTADFLSTDAVFLEIVACNGLVPNLASSTLDGTCFDDPGGVSTTFQISVADVNLTSLSSANPTFTLTTGLAPLNQLWVFFKVIHSGPPYDPEDNQSWRPYGFPVRYVKITYHCNGDKYFSGGSVAANIYDNYENIYAGPTSPTLPVTIDPDNLTEFIASNSVVLDNTFVGGIHSGYSFIAQIQPCGPTNNNQDGRRSVSDSSGGQNTGHSANNINDSPTLIKAFANQIQVYPNPAQNNITISYPCNAAGQLEISIKDVAGRIRYTESVSCNEGSSVQQIVDMSTFEQGVYFIELTLNDQHVVKKIVKL